MDSIFKKWEEELNKVKTDFNKALEEIERLKKELYDLNYGTANKPMGRVIHDDHRLVLSAPEIIIGNVNLAGILNPEGDSTIIIRGTQVGLEAVGFLGKVSTRASRIEQTAENPGIDGKEHRVELQSSVCTQACSITLDSSDVAPRGAFLEPEEAVRGSVRLGAETSINLSAQKSKTHLLDQLDRKVNSLTTAVSFSQTEFNDGLDQFRTKREKIEKLLEEREKIDKETFALRTDYQDLDEINLQIDEISGYLATDFYKRLHTGGDLIELERQKQYFTKLKEEVAKIKDDDFKKKSTNTSITLNGESIQLTSSDGDQNLRTNKEAEVRIVANAVKVDGVFNDQGSLEENSIFSVNTRKVELSTAGKKNVEREKDGTLKNAKLPAEGDVIITSKNVTVQSVDAEMSNKELKGEVLSENGNIVLWAENIGLSNLNTTDVKYNDQGQVTESTCKPKGQIVLLSKQVSVSSMGSQTKDGKTEETGFEDGSGFYVRTKDVSFSAADHQGKSTGSFAVNAKEMQLTSINIDPENQGFKEYAEGGSLSVYAPDLQFVASKNFSANSDEAMQITSKKNLLVNGQESTEVKQGDKNYLQLKGDNAEVSGSKVSLKGDVNANALNVKAQKAGELEVTGALKTKNFSDSILTGSADKGPGNSGMKVDEKKMKIDEKVADKGAVMNEVANKIANQDAILPEALKEEGAGDKIEEGK